MRNIIISGTIANFGQITNDRTSAENERNNAFTVRFINVSMDRKDEETGYTKHAPIKVLANGYLAERLAKFAPMEKVYLVGKLEKEDDYVTEDKSIPGQWIIRVDSIDNWPQAADNEDGGTTTTAAAPAAKPASKKPAAKKKPSIRPNKTA